MSDPAADPQTRIGALIGLTERLTALIAGETRTLLSNRASALAETAEEKARLSRDYEASLRALAQDRTLVERADPAGLRRLKAATEAFRAVLSEHGRIVRRLEAVGEGLIRSVGREIGERKRTVTGYGRDASVRAYGAPAAGSLAISRNI